MRAGSHQWHGRGTGEASALCHSPPASNGARHASPRRRAHGGGAETEQAILGRSRDASVIGRALYEWEGPAWAGPSCSRSVSGILSRAAIRLGRLSPACSLPPTWSSAGRVIAPIGVAPGGACLAAPVTGGAGGLLHHRFTLTPAFTWDVGAVSSLLRYPAGFPVRGLPGTVALWCPDFPRRRSAAAA